MKAIAAGGSFVSRGDGSVTEKKELELPIHRTGKRPSSSAIPSYRMMDAWLPSRWAISGPVMAPVTFVLEVERVIDMGNHQHVVGTIEDERVDLRLPVGVAPPFGRLKPEGTRGFRRGHPAGRDSHLTIA